MFRFLDFDTELGDWGQTRLKPKLHLHKIEQNIPGLRNKLEKLKADREEKARKSNKEFNSAASSVELVEEVINIEAQLDPQATRAS